MELAQKTSSVNYREADPIPKQTLIECLNWYFRLSIDVVKFFVLSIPLYIKFVLNLFFASRKCIKNKVVLITGGGNGLGRCMALEFGKEKCKIAIADIDLIAAKRTAEELIKLYNIEAIAYHTDVGEYKSIVKLHDDIKRDFGRVDILVNNAALLIQDVSLREKEWTDLEPRFNVNFKSHFWTIRLFLEDMIKNRYGHIVAVSSVYGILSQPYAILYSSTKFGIYGLMACLGDEMHLEGHDDYIKTTTICPYFINTAKSLIESIKLRFPPLSPQYVAKVSVDGILKDECLVVIPSIWKIIRILSLITPNSVRHLVMKIIFNASDTRILSPKKDV